ncbi:NAD-dependent epimerase/dehydratase family protein [Pseudomonas entomophila]|uniref:NAD-dependent epimerase/dehydratase family protein n=1 Tax=Pseudomonas entomophila TaxID=312306 RepID=UPI0023D869C3|nr:NAD-dependent epimerase/dehydratase family protein [Pseudomonas entomophila]MDF0729880.1 NAD-dependent epimerase/dehydratase family protein [Pseudomonas entomophila]
MRVMVTGATGFVGSALVETLSSEGEAFEVVAAVRSGAGNLVRRVEVVRVGGVDGSTEWQAALVAVDAVVHLAARAHILDDSCADPLSEFRRINTEGTLNLARQAVLAGVKRFIFVSTIGVHGAQSFGEAFTEQSVLAPHSPYAKSKYEAECGLLEIAHSSTMEVVIIRPPMIFGVQAPGNFARLLRLVASGLPLPFARVNNSRSLLALENMVCFIKTIIAYPGAVGGVYLICDGDDLSVGEMVSSLANGMGRRSNQFPLPKIVMRWLAGMLGRENMYFQLFGSLRIDAGKAREVLGWRPSKSSRQALEEAGRQFKGG